jgi:hypothetical protein
VHGTEKQGYLGKGTDEFSSKKGKKLVFKNFLYGLEVQLKQ